MNDIGYKIWNTFVRPIRTVVKDSLDGNLAREVEKELFVNIQSVLIDTFEPDTDSGI